MHIHELFKMNNTKTISNICILIRFTNLLSGLKALNRKIMMKIEEKKPKCATQINWMQVKTRLTPIKKNCSHNL